MIIKQRSLAHQLSEQIVEALVRVGLTQEDILGGAITHTDLPWQVPPLVIEATLFGVPLSEYLDSVVYVNSEQLYTLWSDALANMKNAPNKVLTYEGYRNMSAALPNVRMNQRHLHLSMPEGFPASIPDLAAITLSLECAHILRTNAKIDNFVSDDSNYYAVLPFGGEIGIKAGLPALWAEVWDGMPVDGMVEEMLRSPRGAVWEGCDYNIISKVRSVVHDYQDKMREFEAVDWALQALRVIDGHAELLSAIKTIKKVAHSRKVRASAINDAWRVVNQLSMTDRQRVETLKNILVPEIMTVGQFSRQVYPFYAVVPPLLADKVLTRMRENIRQIYEQEESLYGS